MSELPNSCPLALGGQAVSGFGLGAVRSEGRTSGCGLHSPTRVRSRRRRRRCLSCRTAVHSRWAGRRYPDLAWGLSDLKAAPPGAAFIRRLGLEADGADEDV